MYYTSNTSFSPNGVACTEPKTTVRNEPETELGADVSELVDRT